MFTAASAACAPCRRLAWGDTAMTRLESNARSPPKRHAQSEPPLDPASPDAMFKSEKSSLRTSASAWWSHMRYILVAALAVSFALHHVAAAVEHLVVVDGVRVGGHLGHPLHRRLIVAAAEPGVRPGVRPGIDGVAPAAGRPLQRVDRGSRPRPRPRQRADPRPPFAAPGW